MPRTKIVQVSAKKTCFQFAERRQSFAKIVQVSAKKTCFQFAERRQSYAKIAFLNDISKSMRLDFRFRRVSVCQRAIRLREAFIFYPLPTEDSLWFLHIGKGQTFQEMTFAMRGNAKPFGKRLSPCAEMPNLSGNDFRHARKCHFFTPHGLVVDERPDIIFYALVYHSIMQCNSIAITKSS